MEGEKSSKGFAVAKNSPRPACGRRLRAGTGSVADAGPVGFAPFVLHPFIVAGRRHFPIIGPAVEGRRWWRVIVLRFEIDSARQNGRASCRDRVSQEG